MYLKCSLILLMVFMPGTAMVQPTPIYGVADIGVTFTEIVNLNPAEILTKNSETLFSMSGGLRSDILTVARQYHVVPWISYKKHFVSNRIVSSATQTTRFEYDIANFTVGLDVQYHFGKQYPKVYFGGGGSINFITFETTMDPAVTDISGRVISVIDEGETRIGIRGVFGGFITPQFGLEGRIVFIQDISQIGLGVFYRFY